MWWMVWSACVLGDIDPSDEGPSGVRLLTGEDVSAGRFGQLIPMSRDCGRSVLAPGDLDGDGVTELLVGCPPGVTDLQVLSGAGLADLEANPVARVRTFELPPPTALGDLDGDGLPELGLGGRAPYPDETAWLVMPGSAITGMVDANAVGWHLGTGRPSLQPRAAGDVDGDGVPDVALHDGARWVVVSGAGLAATPAGGVPAGEPLVALEADEVDDTLPIGDLDGDGRGDLVVLAGRLRLWRSSDAPRLALHELANLGSASSVTALGDLDGDGVVELAVTGQDGVRIVASARLADPGTALDGALLTAEVPTRLVACDVDGDDRPELVTEVGVWAGVDLLAGPAEPIAPGVTGPDFSPDPLACLGDLDGRPGAELVWGDR